MSIKDGIDSNIEKATRFTDFLIKLASLRVKLIRNIDEYPHVLWIKDIPHEKGYYTQAWGPNSEYDEDIWIEIQLPKEPITPDPPQTCLNWVDHETLNTTSRIPQLHKSINHQIKNPNWFAGSEFPELIEQSFHLEDHKEIQSIWDNYIKQKWKPWAELHLKWESIYNIYSILFSIHQTQLKQGEDFELILGLGLLFWQTPSNQQVLRHVIVANAILEFEPHLKKFMIRIHPNGADLRPELNMLDLEEQPVHVEETAKVELKKTFDNPWNRAVIDRILESLAHSINPNGEYEPQLDSGNSSFSSKPIIKFTPALILRKHSAKGLTDVLTKIKEIILNKGIIPYEFSDLAELEKPTESDSSESYETKSIPFETLYFPKPYNEEQLRIINKIQTATGVLVQGPPGTGKSHTIANLICHLLASNKRILVTAKTPRALKVLENLLPEEMRALCIFLLGSGLEEKRSLESSVNGIIQSKENWNESKSHNKIVKLEKALHEYYEEKACIENKLRAIRESESYRHSIGDGSYSGTAAQIAQSINSDKGKFFWFIDRVSHNDQYPFFELDLNRLLINLRMLTADKKNELNMVWPNPLPSIDHIKELFSQELHAQDLEESSSSKAHKEGFEKLYSLNKNEIIELKNHFNLLFEDIQRIQSTSVKWIPDTIKDALAGKFEVIKELNKTCEQIIHKISKFVIKADTADIILSNKHNRKATLEDALILKEYLLSGGKIGWGPFHPKTVNSIKYIIKEVRVNGHLCNDLKHIIDLIEALTVQLEIERGWSFWIGRADRVKGPYSLQFKILESNSKILVDIISIEKRINKIKEILQVFGNPIIPFFHKESYLVSVINICDHILAQINLKEVRQSISKVDSLISAVTSKPNVHPITFDLIASIKYRDFTKYSKSFIKIIQLEKDKQVANWVYSTVHKLKHHLPKLAINLLNDCQNQDWENNLELLPQAWRWGQACSWLNEYINVNDSPILEDRYHQLDEEIRKTTTIIASLRAWSFCFQIMKDEHQRNMAAWQQEMRRLGKGTGKHAPRHRREAQKHLNLCRDAVPAWIMPLHRIWDTVDPLPGMFDFIIVDEASQCGFESLPLLFLAKKILIVGDDKQISPDAVGIPRDSVYKLMNDFLYDFQFKNSFDVDGSLFDQGKLRFGTRHIVLREHFRCMPEIIRFSNDLCYSDTPLIPLRQYPPDRLEPLMHIYLENGYREGSESRVINRPEAKAIVNKIEELCKNDKYNNKSMGVIVLQGEAQANLIEALLLERLGAEEIESRQLICGDPYIFQGDERDIIFLSMVAAPNERIGPLTKSSDERRFNVAASRARDQMWLFHSVTQSDLSTQCLRRKLLEFFEESKEVKIAGININELSRIVNQSNHSQTKPPPPFESWFELDVALEIAKRGFRVIPQYSLANKRIDLVIEGGNSRLAIECDGDQFHGLDEYDQDMSRQRILERCGLVFFRIRASSFYANKQNALEKLWHILEERRIYPHKPKSEKDDSQSKEQDTRNDPNTKSETDSQPYKYSKQKSPNTINSLTISDEQKSNQSEINENAISESLIKIKNVKSSTAKTPIATTIPERSLFPEYSTKIFFKDVLSKYIPKANYSHSDCNEYYSIYIGSRGPYLKCAVCSKTESISPVFIKNALDELKILCPKCMHAVKVKSNQKGGYFIGCSQYPKCTGLIPWLQIQNYIQKIANETSKQKN